MAAVLRVDLTEAEHLAVGERTTHALRNVVEIVNLLRAQCQTFLLVILLKVLDIHDRIWLLVDGEAILTHSFVETLEHRVESSIRSAHWEILLDADNTLETHVLGDLDGIGTPRSNHLTAWTYKPTLKGGLVDDCCTTEKPAKTIDLIGAELVINIYRKYGS